VTAIHDSSGVTVGRELSPTTYRLSLLGLVMHAGGGRDFTPIHFDEAAARRAGARGPFINNVFCLGMWERTVRDFLGPGGVIHAIDRVRISSFNVVGDELVTTGRVERVWVEDGVQLAEIGLQTVNRTIDRVTIGPGVVLVSLPRDGGASLEARYAAAAGDLPIPTPAQASADVAPPWDAVASLIGHELLLVPSLPGADRVEPSVVRRLCEPLELSSPLHDDPAVARSLGYETAAAPVFGVGTTYVAPGIGVGTDARRALPVPEGTVEILTEVGLALRRPIHVGDLLARTSVRIASVVPKTTSVGAGAFITELSEVSSEHGLVASVKKLEFNYRPDPGTNDRRESDA
jgi:acyl dehydratase